jgi:sugar (pentulose or hexulose) kinase
VAGSPVFWGPSATPGRYYQMIFGDVSANLLEAFRNALPNAVGFEVLGEEAANATSGLLKLPRDLTTPELLDHVRSWATSEPTGEAARAIFEGVADSLGDQLERLCGSSRPEEIHSVGGAARSAVWMAIKAKALKSPHARRGLSRADQPRCGIAGDAQADGRIDGGIGGAVRNIGRSH